MTGDCIDKRKRILLSKVERVEFELNRSERVLKKILKENIEQIGQEIH